MEIRKLQYSGKGTYVLSLPKRWLAQHDLTKGSKFAIQELDNGLYITPKFNVNVIKSDTLHVSEYISKEITARYTYGYDRVVVKGPISSHYRTKITDTLRELLGYDIIEETDDQIVITDLLDPSQLNIDKTLRREFFLASLMVQDAIKALCESDILLAEDVMFRDSEVNKLYFLTVRQIRTALQDTSLAETIGVRHLESIDLRIVSKGIEEIADHAASIARRVPDLQRCPPELLERIRDYGMQALSCATQAVHAFMNADKEESAKLLTCRPDFHNAKNGLDKDALLCDQPIVIHDIVENIKGIGERAFEIAQLAYKP